MPNQINDRPARSWLKITIELPAELSEMTALFLATLSGSGTETAEAGESSERIITYLAEDEELQSKQEAMERFLKELQGRLPAGTRLKVDQEQLLEEDWNRSWKEHFKAARLTSRLAIKPSWETYVPQKQELVIELDPGMAFGTGLHASTRLALELIEKCYPPAGQGPQQALDVGTGTGILAMACALLGTGKVTALDNDPEAVEIAFENVRRNRLQDIIAVSGTDLHDLEGSFDLVVANIIHDTLIELAPILRPLLSGRGFLILAGILGGEQENSILTAYQSLGLTALDTRHREEWVALRLTPEADPA
jgi:ribosomal protein L11 methyltransferase